MRSLRGKLIVWLLVPLLVVWVISAWLTYDTAIASTDRAHDRTLLGSVLAIAERISVVDKAVVVDLPYSSLEMLEANNQSRVYYRVSLWGGNHVTGYEDLPPPLSKLEPGQAHFYNAGYRGEKIRVAALSKRLYAESVVEPVLIQVAETAELRESMSWQIMRDSALKGLLLILLAATFIWLAVNRGLLPLYQIRDQISQRTRTDLRHIDVQLVPSELRPLIDAINEHTTQLNQLMNARKQFIADAAHQLKTPLTLLRTQADFASKQTEPAAMNEVLDELRKNTERLAHLIDQLLALNRAEAETIPDLKEVNLTELAESTTFQYLPLALEKSIDLGFEGAETLKIIGHKFLLHELLGNLIDNAIRFTPKSGRVTVRATKRGEGITIVVEDSGPGIPEPERKRIFDRFYQIPGRDSTGCGLGLSIVREIATLHGATISLQDAASHIGTIVIVEFKSMVAVEPSA